MRSFNHEPRHLLHVVDIYLEIFAINDVSLLCGGHPLGHDIRMLYNLAKWFPFCWTP